MKPLVSIQYLRALAAISVVAFHACQWIQPSMPFSVGAAGVDVFFVVSGFIMWTTTNLSPLRPGAFLLRRAVRTLPLYWLATLALALAIALYPPLIPTVRLEPGHLLASLLLIPHTDPAGQPFPLLAAGWTLIYEALFYLVFAAALWLQPANRLAFLAVCLLTVIGLGLAYLPAYPLIANPLLLEFLAGALLGRAWLAGRVPDRPTALGLIAVALAVLAWQQVIGSRGDLMRPLWWGGPAALIVAGAVGLEQAGGLVRAPWAQRPLRRLGDASYSIYLCHPMAVGLVAATLGPQNPAVFLPVAITAALVLGLLCHQRIERPLLGWLRARLLSPAALSAPGLPAGPAPPPPQRP